MPTNLLKKSSYLAALAAISKFINPTQVMAQGPKAWDANYCTYTTDSGQQVATIQGLSCAIGNVLSFAITGLGLIAFAMFIFAAFKYMLAGSDSKNVQSARSTMTFAIVGIVVALSAFIIIELVAGFTGVSIIRQFRIPGPDTGL